MSKVKAKLIIEMLGSPKAHVEKTLNDYLARLREDTSLTLLSQDIAEASAQKELFSIFAELVIEFKNTTKLLDFCFESMPSSVEILEPEELVLPSGDLTDLINDLQARLHTVDMSMKQLSAKTSIVDRNAMNVLHNFVKHLLKEGARTPDQLSPIIGIKTPQLVAFLEHMVDEGKLKQTGETFALL